jgi:pimeloyl-ACP methyl ester carboxylesterase
MNINHKEFGKGYPVILIHGFGESHTIWEPIAEKLGSKYRVLIPDLPGFGESSPLPFDHSIDMVANSIYDWMKKNNIAECIIIGHSLGGYVTLEIAKKFPNIVSAIGLIHSTALADTPEKRIGREKSIEFIQKHGVAKFIDSFVPMLFYEKYRDKHKAAIDRVMEEGRNIPEKTLTDYMLSMRDRDDSTDFLKEFEKPILFVFGEEDTSIPPARSKEQIKFMLNPYLKNLPETGHMGMIEREEEIFNTISKFVEVAHK